MVRACLAIWQWSMEDRLLSDNCPELEKVSIRNWSFTHWKPRCGGIIKEDQRNLTQQSVRRNPYWV